MNISCVICGDTFTGLKPDESVYSTKCGHLFHYGCLTEWFKRSKSCPQCRQQTTDKTIIRIFFNNSAQSNIDSNPVLLKDRVDSLEFQLKMSESKVKVLNEERKKTEDRNKGLRKEIREMQQKVVSSEQLAHALREELKVLKNAMKGFTEVKLENEELKQKLVACNSVKWILNGSIEETDCVIDNSDLKVEHLQELVKHFKRRVKILEKEHRETEKELYSFKRKVASQNKTIKDMEENNEMLKRCQDFGRKNYEVNNTSIVELSSDGEGYSSAGRMSHVSNSRQLDDSAERKDMKRREKELLKEEINRDSRQLDDSAKRKDMKLSFGVLKEQVNVRFSKPDLRCSSNSTSLLCFPQSKLSMGRIPKVKSSTSASGDDIFHPTKYSAPGKVIKKSKKCLSAAAHPPTVHKVLIITAADQPNSK